MAENQQSNQKPQDQKPGLTWSQPAGAQRNAQPQAKQSSAAATTESGGRVIGIILGVVIVLALVVWGITALRQRGETVSSTASSTAEVATEQTEEGSTETATTGQTQPVEETIAPAETTTTPAVTPSVSGASFSAPAQPAGTSVAVTGLSLTQPTWVVVYESRNSKPGNILGAGLFFAGDSAVSVPLMRTTVAGQTYYVTEVIDNGDKIFSVKEEKPVMDTAGAQVWTTFVAQ
jgi:hypothetical protein